MIAYSILIYLCIAVICNVTYFFACQGDYPKCGTISLILVNVAILCQILPKLTNNCRDEKNQKNGQHFLCSSYLIAEIIIASFCTVRDVAFATAGTIQILMLGIFLITYFGIARANVKTNQSIAESRTNRSMALLEANAQLRNAIAMCHTSMHRDILRESFAELNSIPMSSDEMLNQLDSEIWNKVSVLCNAPDTQKQKELSRLINRRKTMQMVINQ